ncbi:MAG: hypothetical protein IPG67_05700 [Acidobacteria bacterium]|nr:hypothetical protein [Acidobacteriota bacterium]
MAPSLPSALGASEASLLEMTSAYSVFPNKGIRMTPHLIRKVYNRDGTLLEEYDGGSSKVTSEYVALTMVKMMRGVVQGGGTATGASAAGFPLAGKTGTVNNETDVWFIGYTPTYVTGIWMGNPLRKSSLGAGMTGGHGAVPYFNAFMNVFMKGKPRDSFPEPPPMPSDIKNLAERNKREELEKLSEADLKARQSGVAMPNPKVNTDPVLLPPDKVGGDTTPETPDTKPNTPADTGPTIRRPDVKPPVTKPDPPAEKPAGEKRKGKKGDG